MVASPAGEKGTQLIELGSETEECSKTSNVVVEHNLIENIESNDGEIISIKMTAASVRFNTIKNSSGFISSRSGSAHTITGNYIFGNGKLNSGGIAAASRDSVITNNYITMVRI